VAFDEELLLVSALATKPEVDRVRRDRRGQGPEVPRWAASDAGELFEAPVRQPESDAGCVVEDERIGSDSLGPKVDRVNRVRVETLATAACGVMKRRNAGVPFVGWPGGPFPMGGERGNSRHKCSVHGVLLVSARWAVEGRTGSTSRDDAWRGGR